MLRVSRPGGVPERPRAGPQPLSDLKGFLVGPEARGLSLGRLPPALGRLPPAPLGPHRPNTPLRPGPCLRLRPGATAGGAAVPGGCSRADAREQRLPGSWGDQAGYARFQARACTQASRPAGFPSAPARAHALHTRAPTPRRYDRIDRGSSPRSSSSKRPRARIVSTPAGTVPSRMRPRFARRMPVRMGCP